VLFESSISTNVHDWSRDGRFLLVRQTPTGRGRDLLAVLLADGRQIMPIANTPFEERDGQFSPDAQWVAYASNESGRYEIYVQAFPEPKVRRRISPEGGHQPRWRGDGRELFYVTDDGTLVAVPIKVDASLKTLDVDVPQPLFKTAIVAVNPGGQSHQYAVTPDGARFLINTRIDNSEQVAPITLIVNWTALTRAQ
jgi:dipeptidyl aminopeptidase/acylaminoacyl peptidase